MINIEKINIEWKGIGKMNDDSINYDIIIKHEKQNTHEHQTIKEML
jgi:hypothetical protein